MYIFSPDRTAGGTPLYCMQQKWVGLTLGECTICVYAIGLKMEALLNVWYERFEATKASIDHSIENGGE